MTNKELSAAIRKDLKENGIQRKDVSVKVRDALYDTSVYITIKNPLIRKSDVEAVAKKYDEIDRDERTMEILAGGNTFVLVQYEYGIFEEVAAPLLATAEKVLNDKEKYSGHKIAETAEKEAYITHYDGNEWTLCERDKKEPANYTYRPTFWIRTARDLAVAMWRFKNIGTIYA